MRFFALAAVLAISSAEVLKLGYGLGNGDLQFDLVTGTKYSTRPYSLVVPSWATFNGVGSVDNANWFLSVRLQVNVADCLQCGGQTIDMYYRIGGTGNAGPTDTAVLTRAGGLALTTSGIWADIPLPSLMTGEQTVNFFVNITCQQCSRSAELSRLEAIVRNVDKSMPAAPVTVYGSFDRDSDRNTDFFEGPVGSWGPVVRIPNIVAGDYIIVLPDIALTSGGAGVVYYFSNNQTGFGTGIATYDQATLNCAVPTGNGCSSVAVFSAPAATPFRRAPSSSYSSGQFATDQTRIGDAATGTWYVAPFITRKGTGTATPNFRFALGLNAVPAAAAGIVPSFIVVAVATVFAALRV